jgi:hypothetical protein
MFLLGFILSKPRSHSRRLHKARESHNLDPVGRSSATSASATNSSGRDGSAASAAASSVQPSAAVSACRRRSRASITAMSISRLSRRCKPSPPYQWRPWSQFCACVPWGDPGACRLHWCGVAVHAPARPVNGTTPFGALCAAQTHSGGARARHSSAVCGHPSCQSDLRSTPTIIIGTARGAGPTSIIGMQPRRPRCAARQVNKRTHSNSRHASTLPMLEGWDQSRYRCGSGEPSPGAD